MMYKSGILFIFAAAVLLFLLFRGQARDSRSSLEPGDIRVGGVVFHTEIMSDPESRAQGFSGRDGLPENEGMLFLFPKAGKYSFWMKDMRFPIDILWIANGAVVFIAEKVPAPKTPDEFPAIVSPSVSADMVLEIPAGSRERFGIVIGAPVAVRIPEGTVIR